MGYSFPERQKQRAVPEEEQRALNDSRVRVEELQRKDRDPASADYDEDSDPDQLS